MEDKFTTNLLAAADFISITKGLAQEEGLPVAKTDMFTELNHEIYALLDIILNEYHKTINYRLQEVKRGS
jgi:D-alanine-D-alanine ligase-like ATP-grasp enzyme